MHSVSPYFIKVHDKNLPGPRDEKYHDLDKIRKKDLLTVFEEFAATNSIELAKIENDKSKKSFQCRSHNRKGRMLFGIIEFGNFGIGSNLIDTRNGKKNYRKKKFESDVNEYHYCLYVPKGKKEALLLLHNIHGKGAKQTLEGLFKEFFKNKFDGLVPSMKPFSYQKVIDEWYQNAAVKEIKLSKYVGKMPGDSAVQSLAQSSMEVVYKPSKKGGKFGSMKHLLGLRDKPDSDFGKAIVTWQEMCASVKVKVEHNNKSRTFSLSQNSDPLSAIEFDESDVEMNSDGEPKHKPMRDYLEGLVKDMGADFFG